MQKECKMDDISDAGPSNPMRRAKVMVDDKMDQQINVYVWDMDETLILLKSLLNGTYAAGFNGLKDAQKGLEIGRKWEDYILQLCDQYFYYEQLENYNQPSLDVLKEYDDRQDLSHYDFCNDNFGPPYDNNWKRKLAYRHRVIAHKYEKGLHEVLDGDQKKLWDNLYESTDIFTDKWLSSARALMELCCGGDMSNCNIASPAEIENTCVRNVHVLVTSGSLIPSLVKCLLFRLDDLITHENVYSSWDVGKPQCFSLINKRFGNPNVRFCVIGDGWEECEAAERMKWPFIKIDFRLDSGFHRFPGLTLKTIGHYVSIVYEVSVDEKNEC